MTPRWSGRTTKKSRTAEYVALYRALETDETAREPLFRDPFATRFLPRELVLALRLARIRPLRAVLTRYADYRAPGARTSAIGRTRFIDDVVRRAVAAGVRQLVVLGAGYDCRAHRMPELAGVAVFEVDRAPTQAEKRARIAEVATRPVRYVAHDFGDARTLADILGPAGWDAAQPTLFVLEGVTNYLDAEAVDKLLRAAGSAAPGSEIVFTYVHKGALDGSVAFEGADKLVANVRSLGEPWRFGLDPADVAPFVAACGLELVEDLGADSYRRRYLVGDDLRGYAFYRIAVARVTSS
jgi:methyltransferase (TIGR00027 family)